MCGDGECEKDQERVDLHFTCVYYYKKSILQFLPEYSIVGLIYKVIDDQVNYCREIGLWRLRM